VHLQTIASDCSDTSHWQEMLSFCSTWVHRY